MSTSETIGAIKPPIEQRLRFSAVGLALIGLAVFMTLVPYWPALSALFDIWNLQPEYSHGILIPPIAGYLLWRERSWLVATEFPGSWFGIVIILLSLLMWFVGELSTIYVIVQYSFVLAVFGLVLALTGWHVFRRLWVPLLVLLFMVPLPAFLYSSLSLELQLLSSRLGVAIIKLAGVSVFLEGNVIDLGVYTLQVAEACDGLRYLFPMMTLAFIVAYFFRAPMWKRVLLFAVSVPISILMNSLRIGVIGITVEHWGTEMAEGVLHDFQGWMVFMLSLAMLLAFAACLTRVGPSRRAWSDSFALDGAPPPTGSVSGVRPVPAPFLAALALISVAAAGTLALPQRVEVPPQRAAFVEFPTSIAEWSGRSSALDSVYVEALKLTDYLLNDYVRQGSGTPVSLYSAYYESQRKGQSAHSPRSCLPGGGWRITTLEQVTLDSVLIDNRPLRVNRAVIEHEGQRQIMYYWFQQRGRVITNEYAVKWFIFWDALTRNRSDGALVRLAAPVAEGVDVATVDAELTRFATAIAPQLSRYVPN